MNDFEQFLKQRRRVPAVPAQWRKGILAAAHAQSPAETPLEKTADAKPWWLVWLWPSPVAWAGIGCAWMVALGMNAASQSPEEGRVAAMEEQHPGIVYTTFLEERRLVREIFQQQEDPAPPPRRDPSGASNERPVRRQTITA